MKVPNQFRLGAAIKYNGLQHLYSANDAGNRGGFVLPMEGKTKGHFFLCIASDGMEWEHVSVTVLAQKRCPTWEEMCYIKSVFWENDESVMQLHPPRKDWVNHHPYCLHLWRPLNGEIPLPPKIMVGSNRFNTSKNNTAL